MLHLEIDAHKGGVTTLSYLPDGSAILSAGTDGAVKLWNAETGVLLKEFSPSHVKTASAIASPFGKLAVSGGADGVVRVWDLSSGSMVRSCSPEKEENLIFAIALSPSGDMILTGSSRGKIQVWDLLTQKLLGEATLQSSAITSMNFIKNLVISASTDGSFIIADIFNNSVEKELSAHEGMVNSFDISSEGQIVSGGIDHTIRLWDEAWKCLGVVGEQPEWVNYVAFGPVTQIIASASTDGMVYLWDIEQRGAHHAIRSFEAHERWINAMAFSPNEEFLATAGGDGLIRVWVI